jgi:nucleotide-binding universal stress UspA family protein
MKTILVITDHTAEAEHAAVFALMVAQIVGADILIADTLKVKQLNKDQRVFAGPANEQPEETMLNAKEQLELIINPDGAYLPVISEIDISDYETADLIGLINRNDIWLLVLGMPDTLSGSAGNLNVNIQSVLNRVHCPLLLIPQGWELKLLERIVYIADLRYCRLPVLKYLAGVAAPFDAGISIAHLSAKGMVHIVGSYADAIFQNEIIPHIHYDKMSLNNTRERDLHKAVDVLINGMHNDLIVLVNHRYHFEGIIGRCIGDVLPAEITVPVLIFPM